VRTGETTAYAVELRLKMVNDSQSVDSSVLIYKVDSSVWTGYGPVQVVDAVPAWPTPATIYNLDVACFGAGSGRVSSYTDAAAGVTITVVKQSGENAWVKVTKATDTIF
jgi:hypothetical protein